MTTGPTINRGSSNQDYQTPKNFMDAVKSRFGPIAFDLAASSENRQHDQYFTEAENSLTRTWSDIQGTLWLNPPFDRIEPWAQKCAAESALGARILFLTPASIGANWFKQWVQPSAVVIGLNGRLCFDGIAPYPKDCQLAVFWAGLTGFQTWSWK